MVEPLGSIIDIQDNAHSTDTTSIGPTTDKRQSVAVDGYIENRASVLCHVPHGCLPCPML